jgi:hypothetical protein
MNVRSDFTAGLIIGVVLCMWLNAAPFSDATLYRDAIKACEKELPRDQHCKVIGVPE